MKCVKQFSVVVISLCILYVAEGENLVGIGKADVTGPAVEIPLMGYGKSNQAAGGIHTRLFSRSFIFQNKGSSNDVVVFVSVDLAMIGHLMKQKVVEKLSEKLGSDLFRHDNLVISATHTHSGPSGYMQYLLFSTTSMGFNDDSFKAIVNGIVLSIVRAHQNMRLSTIYFVEGQLDDTNINRSPTSYLANPKEERMRYKFDTDHDFVQINILDAKTKNFRGLINWFAVHPTSMNNTNILISGDNKGIASLMMEKHMNKGRTSTNDPFVAAFASANLGDTSPNTESPRCMNSREPCSNNRSTCEGESDNWCVAFGPGKDMWESTKIIGKKQFEKSFELLNIPVEDQILIDGDFRVAFQWIDMTNQTVRLDNGDMVKTCKPALGYSFAAGTTDGPGEFDFEQGTKTENLLWNFVRDFIKAPSKEQIECHDPKPILLNTGDMTFPYQWHPEIVDTQILSLGSFWIAAVPGEFTTMAGRRLRDTIKDVAARKSKDIKVVIGGLSNIYTHYITTAEEYQKQRYEAASTIYGPFTLAAYQQQYKALAEKIITKDNLNEGPRPPDMYETVKGYGDFFGFFTEVKFDGKPIGYNFGDCLLQPSDLYYRRKDIVMAEFVSGNLRNDVRSEKSFLYIERLDDENWEVVATDTDWETKIYWIRTNSLLGFSKVQITWEISANVLPGRYKVRHVGSYKYWLTGAIYEYEGETKPFEVR